MIALLGNWRVISAALAGVMVLGFLAMLAHERNGRQAAEAERDSAKAVAAGYAAQAALNQTAGTEAVKAEATATRVTRQAHEATHVIQAAPGASQALPGPVRDEWLRALRVLRDEGFSVPFPVDPGSGKPADQLPAG